MKQDSYFKRLPKKIKKLYRITIGGKIWNFQRKYLPVPCRSKEFVSLFSNLTDYPYADISPIADRLIKGEYQFLGVEIKSEVIPDWQKDYLGNFVWPMAPFNKIRTITPQGVEIKNPWELSSFFHLFPVAVAYCHTKKEKYKKFIIDQLNDWIQKNPCPFGVNWANPMNVALRLILIVEIIAAIENTDGEMINIGNLNASLWDHILFILNNLENLGITPANHYITNIVGLLWGGLYFCNKNLLVSHIRKSVLKRLSFEIQRQVHSDGMNFEGSIGYHRLVTELFLYAAIIMNKNNISISRDFMTRLNAMLQVLSDITLPNGNLPLIGDNDDCKLFWTHDYYSSKKQNAADLLNVGAIYFMRDEWRSGNDVSKLLSIWIFGDDRSKQQFPNKPISDSCNRSVALKKSHIYICKMDKDCLIINCNHPGQPGCGHSHNDTLSFVLCLHGDEIFIDPGTYVYTRSVRARNLFRSTGYHNVVRINGEEQWPLSLSSPFIIPKKISPKVLTWKSNSEEDIFEGEHYGYLRLPEKVIHRRLFHYKKNIGELLIRDHIFSTSKGINGENALRIETFFHISSELSIEKQSENTSLIFSHNRGCFPICQMRWEENDTPRVEFKKAWASNNYGKKHDAEMVVFTTMAYPPYFFEYKIKKIERNQ